jgi:peptidoglycan/LPS O-acetylase OafA/YrhL
MQNTPTPAASESARRRSTRLHYLDWLSVLLILGVFLFHAVHPFDTIAWHIKNPEQSEVLTYIIGFFFMWGMPLFFLVAGAGSHFALRRRSGRQFANERVKRLLIPFFVGAILLSPIMIYLEQLQQAKFAGSFFAYLPEFFRSRVVAFSPTISSNWGTHLWFLAFLFAFSIIALPLFLWFKRDSGRRVIDRLGKLGEIRGGILLFVVPMVVVILLLEPLYPGEHDWQDFFSYFVFFVLGYIFYADQRFTRAVRRDGKLIAVVAIVSLISIFGIRIAAGDTLISTPGTLEYFLARSLWALVAWTWTLLFLGIAMRVLDYTNSWLKYWREAQLPFFVLHQPVIIVIAYYVVQWDTGILPKLLVVVVSSFLVTVGLYELFIRRIGPVRAFFGMKPRVGAGDAQRPEMSGEV